MAVKNAKDETLTIRVSTRIRQRFERVLDGEQMSETIRLLILREIERRERRGNGHG